jgi:hypothetical protein
MKPQRRHALLLPTFWEAAVIRSARATTKTFPTAQMPLTAEGAAPGWGKLSTPLPRPGLAQGRTSDTKPALSIRPRRSRKCQPRMMRPFSRDHWSVALLSDLCAFRMGFRGPAESPLHRGPCAGTPAWNEGWRSVFPHRALRGTLGSAPFRMLAELVGFGNRGKPAAAPDTVAGGGSSANTIGFGDQEPR